MWCDHGVEHFPCRCAREGGASRPRMQPRRRRRLPHAQRTPERASGMRQQTFAVRPAALSQAMPKHDLRSRVPPSPQEQSRYGDRKARAGTTLCIFERRLQSTWRQRWAWMGGRDVQDAARCRCPRVPSSMGSPCAKQREAGATRAQSTRTGTLHRRLLRTPQAAASPVTLATAGAVHCSTLTTASSGSLVWTWMRLSAGKRCTRPRSIVLRAGGDRALIQVVRSSRWRPSVAPAAGSVWRPANMARHVDEVIARGHRVLQHITSIRPWLLSAATARELVFGAALSPVVYATASPPRHALDGFVLWPVRVGAIVGCLRRGRVTARLARRSTLLCERIVRRDQRCQLRAFCSRHRLTFSNASAPETRLLSPSMLLPLLHLRALPLSRLRKDTPVADRLAAVEARVSANPAEATDTDPDVVGGLLRIGCCLVRGVPGVWGVCVFVYSRDKGTDRAAYGAHCGPPGVSGLVVRRKIHRLAILPGRPCPRPRRGIRSFHRAYLGAASPAVPAWRALNPWCTDLRSRSEN
jgi:hypothetical protein